MKRVSSRTHDPSKYAHVQKAKRYADGGSTGKKSSGPVGVEFLGDGERQIAPRIPSGRIGSEFENYMKKPLK